MAEMSPGRWLELLERKLDERWFRRLGIYDAYYEGDHALAFATAKFREAFGSLFGALADNWMQIVVDSTVERLEVQGFRFGRSQDADEEAWDIWQASEMDAASDEVHTEASKLEEAYWLVSPPDGDGLPRITAEHPSQVIVACARGDRTRRDAALKKWTDTDGFAYANVYLPGGIVKYRSSHELSKGGITGRQINWVQIDSAPHSLGAVPIIPVQNNPSMLRGGTSDIKVALPIQNAVNKLLCDMLIGSEYQAFPQRVLLGVDIPRDENGQPIRASELKASQSRLWVFGNADAKVAEFNASDLDNYVKAIRELINHLTAQTRTPPHYVSGQIVNASGDALKAAETGLVSKTRRKMKPFGAAHEETMRLAFKALGDDDRANETRAETIWKDPETRSQGELVDSLVKLGTIGVPQEVLWERAGFSPTEIDRMRSMAEAEKLLADTLAPQTPPGQNGQPQMVPGAGVPAVAPAN